MNTFASVSGIIISIEPFFVTPEDDTFCTLLIGVQSHPQDITYFIVDQSTYIVNHATLRKGDYVTAYYDTTVPTVLIYPPRYRAVVVAKKPRDYFIKVDYFDHQLISSDHQLKLQVSPRTSIVLPNHQHYLGNIQNHNLVVLYHTSTKSIPALTTPARIIVLCYPTSH